jgi:hypothetical protein
VNKDLPDPAGLLGALANPARLRLLADVADAGENGCTMDGLPRGNMTAKQVRDHVSRLVQVGLVEPGGAGFVARLDRLHQAHDALTSGDDPEVTTFFRKGRLVELPRSPVRRRAVLTQIAQLFEHGRTYSEAQVNAILWEVHDDHAALRRNMVDFGILERDRRGMQYRLGRPDE